MEKNNTTREEIADATSDHQESQIPKTEIPGKTPLLPSKRMLIVILMFLCSLNFIFIHYNINTAIVEMTSTKRIIKNNATILYPPEYDWDSKTIGLITSSTSYGALLTFIGGYFVNKLGGSMICVISSMACGIATFLHPFCLRQNFHFLLTCRFLTGIFGNLIIISVMEILSHWVPKNEKSTLVSFAVNGLAVGHTLVHSFCGYLAYRWNWRMVFYVTGTMSCILSILCLVFVKDRPSQDKWMSKKERLYILSQTDSTSEKHLKHPYKKILSSCPVWILIVTNIGASWTASMMGLSLPLYIRDITGRNTKDVGLFSSIPSLVSIFTIPFVGALVDFWKNHTTTSISRIHKIIMTAGCIGEIALFTVAINVSNFTVCMAAFALIRIITTLQYLILQFIRISIAPNSTGVIAGFTSFGVSSGVIMAQMSIGFMTNSHTRDEWNNCFILTSVVIAIWALVFTLKGSSEPQSWAISSACIETPPSSQKTPV